ncbi:MAG: hypothetical protein ACI4XW_12365, partial [Candidatus Spyradocola sp.]
IKPASSHSVKHSEDVMPKNNEEIRVDTSLHGVVVTYDAGATPFESGQFAVSVANATTVEYYYRPGVEVNCELILNGDEVQANDKLYAGDYEVVLNFINPLSGKVIESELLSAAKFTLTVMNNDAEQVVNNQTGSITLAEGSVSIDAVAELPGNVFLTSRRDYMVLPEPIELNLEFTPDQAAYTPDRLGEKGEPIVVRATNSQTGQPLSQQEWEQTEVVAEEFEGVGWSIVKGQEVSTWELRPVSKDGTFDSILPGKYDAEVSARYEMDGQTAYGDDSLTITMNEYAGNALDISISSPTGSYDLNDMSNPESMLVSVRYEEPQTGQFLPLTEEMWNTFTIQAASEDRMSWNIEKGAEVGTWVLTPSYYLGDPLISDSGRVQVSIGAEGKAGNLSYSGSGSQQADFMKLDPLSLIKLIAPRVLAAVFILWLIIGYIKKKRLHTRGLDPRCRYRNNTSPRQRISKDFLSVVLPYVPEKATVMCHKGAFQCKFPNLRIQATGRRSFRIINKSIPLGTTKICGEFYSDMETLKNRSFSFGSFDITSTEPRTRRNLGTFSFR